MSIFLHMSIQQMIMKNGLIDYKQDHMLKIQQILIIIIIKFLILITGKEQHEKTCSIINVMAWIICGIVEMEIHQVIISVMVHIITTMAQ